jgi:FMN-dependent NADH-azoreductase
MKLLHVDSAITGDQSVSRRLSADVVAHLKTTDPTIDVTYRDLVAKPFGHLLLSDMPAPGESTPAVDEFVDADIVVIGAPMYNFTVSTQLKAWIDRILIAGKTFRYTEAGPIGLAGHKRVIVTVSRGNLYSADAPAAKDEHVETYLKTIFGLMGVTPEFVIAEGLHVGPDQLKATMAQAEQAIRGLAA